MSVETRIYSPMAPLTEAEFRSAGKRAGFAYRLVDEDGQPLKTLPAGPLQGGFVVLAWPSSDEATTSAIDAALPSGDKPAIDALGLGGKLGWCGLQVREFDYDEHWKGDPEVAEYEEEIGPEKLEAIKSCKTIYWLRSGLRPKQCAQLVDTLEALFKASAGGITDRT